MKVTHVMSDGTTRDSLDGFVIPLNESTETAYMLITRRKLVLDKTQCKKTIESVKK